MRSCVGGVLVNVWRCSMPRSWGVVTWATRAKPLDRLESHE